MHLHILGFKQKLLELNEKCALGSKEIKTLSN